MSCSGDLNGVSRCGSEMGNDGGRLWLFMVVLRCFCFPIEYDVVCIFGVSMWIS